MTNGNDRVYPGQQTKQVKSVNLKGFGDDLPAFITTEADGLTKREYFAAMAMQGLLSNMVVESWTQQAIATDAADLADALIEALNK